MPDLFLPIFFGGFDLQHHLISCWTIDKDKKRVITGAMNGDIIIWDYQHQLTPLYHLSPHLMHHVGSVTAILIMKRPFAEFQDGRINCIVSVHEDKRVRLWSMQDGKMLLISDHDPFPFTKYIDQLHPVGEKDSRYVVCFGQGTAVYIYDLWKMCCSKIFEMSEEFDKPRFTILSHFMQEFAIIDSKFRVYKIDISHFRKPERQNYLKYVEKKNQSGQEKGKKKIQIRMASVYSLKGLPTRKIITTVYNNRSGILAVVYSKQVVIINQPFKESEQQREMCCISSSCGIAKFRNVHICKSHGSTYYIFEQIDGSCSFIKESDLVDILQLLKVGSQQSINYGFSALSFHKQSNQTIGYLQINLRQQLTPIQPSQYVLQSNVFTNNEHLFRRNGNVIELYDLDMKPYDQQLSIFTLIETEFNNTKLSSDGCNVFVDITSYYVDDKQSNQCLQLQYHSTYLDQYEQHNLLDQLNDIPTRISEQLQTILDISCVIIGLYNKSDLFVFISTKHGYVHALPYFYNDNKPYHMYSHHCSDSPITKMNFNKNTLFCVDDSLRIYAFSLSSIFGRFDNQPAQFIPTYTSSVSSHISKVLKIHQIEQYNTVFTAQDALQIKRKLIKHLVAFQLEDDSILIYHSVLNQRHYLMYNMFKPSTAPILLFYAPLFMHFLLVKDKQVCIWSIEKGNFERMIDLESVQPIFSLETYLDTHVAQMVNVHDYKVFKDNSVEISQFDLLEFSNRSFHNQINYYNEIKHTEQFYENLGLLQKLTNSLEFSDVLNLTYYDPPTVFHRSKSIAIFRRQFKDYEDMFQIHLLHQRKYTTPLNFNRRNKLAPQLIDTVNQHYFMLWFDCKLNSQLVLDCIENSHSPKLPLTYAQFYVPLQNKAIFKCQFGIQGIGEGVTRCYQPNYWGASGQMAAQYSVAAALCLKQLFSNQNPLDLIPCKNAPSMLILARFSLDSDKDVIEIACQLIRRQIEQLKLQQHQLSNELLTLHRSSKEFLLYFEKYHSAEGSRNFFSLEIMCLVIQVYLSQQLPNNEEMNNYIFGRLIQGINQSHCLTHPNILLVCLKLLDDGILILQKCITNPKQLFHLLIQQLYYYINTILKHKRFLNEIMNLHGSAKKQKDRLKEHVELFKQFGQLSGGTLKRLRQMIKTLLLTLSHHFYEDFMVMMKQPNLEGFLISNSIIDIMRHHLKGNANSESSDIIQFMDIAIKMIDQANPTIRKQCYGSFMKFITMLNEHFAKVSYSQIRQKVAIAHEGIIQLYDLRYGVKLSSLDRYQTHITTISFDHMGKYLASLSSKESNLKVFQLKPTGSFLQSYENVYIKLSHQYINVIAQESAALDWDDESQYLYIDGSQVFRLD